MVLTIKIPDVTKESSTWMFRHEFRHLVPFIITYAFSFMMIGIFWINHHHMFHLLEKTDELLLVQNLFFLFFMSLIPLGTAMVSANPKMSESAALYGAIMLLTTISFAIMRIYALRKELIYQHKDNQLTNTIRRVSLKARTKSIVGSIAYLFTIPLAFINVYIAYFIFLIPPVIFFIPDGIDNEELAERIEEKNE